MKSGAHINDARLRALPGYNLRRAYLHIVAQHKDWMQRYEIGVVDFSVMVLIDANPGIRATQLCDALGVAKPNMANLIDRLVTRDWIARERSSTDARVSQLTLTAQGERAIHAAEALAQASERIALESMSQTDAATLNTLLQRIYVA
jgi:DNA-binding MarR family transcriptional regulator